MKTQLCSVFLVAFAAFSLCEDRALPMKEYLEVCAEEHHIGVDNMNKFRDFRPDVFAHIDRVSENMKCMMKCLLENMDIMHAGALIADNLAKYIKNASCFKDHQAAIEEAIEECTKESGDTECDTAFKVTRCYKKHKARLTE